MQKLPTAIDFDFVGDWMFRGATALVLYDLKYFPSIFVYCLLAGTVLWVCRAGSSTNSSDGVCFVRSWIGFM